MPLIDQASVVKSLLLPIWLLSSLFNVVVYTSYRYQLALEMGSVMHFLIVFKYMHSEHTDAVTTITGRLTPAADTYTI